MTNSEYFFTCVVSILDTFLTRRFNPYFIIRDILVAPYAFWLFHVKKRSSYSIPHPYDAAIYRFYPKLAEQDGAPIALKRRLAREAAQKRAQARERGRSQAG